MDDRNCSILGIFASLPIREAGPSTLDKDHDMAVTSPSETVVHLHRAGCSLLLEITDGALPAVVHWGGKILNYFA